ncbi:MAG: type II toxin-antitoxin system ParD family antitoxin [Bryobacteraceae bacterium]
MEINLTPGQKAFVRYAIESGRLQRPEEAVEEALVMWEDHERKRVEILMAVDESENDIDAGRYIEYTNATLPQLAEDLKREARARV